MGPSRDPKLTLPKVLGPCGPRVPLGNFTKFGVRDVREAPNVRNFSAQILEVVCADLRADLFKRPILVYRMGLIKEARSAH